MPFAFKDKEFNKVAAFFNVFTFLLTCSALVQPSWFRIKGLHCTQRLSLVQFFTFDEDDDDDEDQINLRQNEFESQRQDFNGNYLLIDLMSCMYLSFVPEISNYLKCSTQVLAFAVSNALCMYVLVGIKSPHKKIVVIL